MGEWASAWDYLSKFAWGFANDFAAGSYIVYLCVSGTGGMCR